MIVVAGFAGFVVIAVGAGIAAIRFIANGRRWPGAFAGAATLSGLTFALLLAPLARECATSKGCRWTERLSRLRRDAVVVDVHGERIGGLRRYPWVPATRLPNTFVNVLLESEDRHFRGHHGVSAVGVTRAIYQDLRVLVFGGSPTTSHQGGSTIDMQLLARLLPVTVLGQETTGPQKLARKVREIFGALDLRASVGSDAVLEAYANSVPLKRAAGLSEAAAVYLNCTPDQLTLSQAATLVVAIPAPVERDPIAQPVQARIARNRLLHALAVRHPADARRLHRAMEDSLLIHCRSTGPASSARDVQIAIRDRLRGVQERPDTVRTTIDWALQNAVQSIVDRLARELESKAPRPRRSNNPVQAVGIVLDSGGAVRAFVCGRSDTEWRFDRCRTPLPLNSVAKAFIVAALLQERKISPGEYFGQIELAAGYPVEENEYVKSRCAKEKPRQLATVTEMVAVSNNCFALNAFRLLDDSAFAVLHRVGIPLRPGMLPDALGVVGVPLLDLAGAFASFVTGHVVRPTFLPNAPAAMPEVFWDPSVRDSIRVVLEGVVQRGTARGIESILGDSAGAFAKTGTDNTNSRVTLAGYYPPAHMTILVWAGRDHPEPILPPHGVNAGDVLSGSWASIAQATPRAAQGVIQP